MAAPPTGSTLARPVIQVVTSHQQTEGAGIRIWRPFPGELPLEAADPFLLLDQAGPTVNGPEEALGAPWHPHRGIETVSYIIDGEIAHHDSNGGGGVIGEGDTQWMTAGAGILHDELPTERLFRRGGMVHGVQLWVNLPAQLKFSHPRYQAITADALRLLTTPDGGALIRLIAGDLGEFSGPGVTFTPITYLHATVAPGAELALPAEPDVQRLRLCAHRPGSRRPRTTDRFSTTSSRCSDPATYVVLRAPESQTQDSARLEVLVLGGLPLREPIVHYGPFVMNSREEIIHAIEDYQQGRLGTIPADQIAPRHFA